MFERATEWPCAAATAPKRVAGGHVDRHRRQFSGEDERVRRRVVVSDAFVQSSTQFVVELAVRAFAQASTSARIRPEHRSIGRRKRFQLVENSGQTSADLRATDRLGVQTDEMSAGEDDVAGRGRDAARFRPM